jgi:hypothetical protein
VSEHVVIVKLDTDDEATLDALADMSGRTEQSILKSIVTDAICRLGADPRVVDHRRAQVVDRNRSEQAKARDDAIVAFIGEHQRSRGYPPSVREIGDAFGWSSASTTHHHLRSLHRQGRLIWQPNGKRTLRVVGENPGEKHPL